MPFTNAEAIRLKLQGFAGDCVLALEAGLPKETLEAIEQILLPAPTEAQKVQAYAEAQVVLAARGVRSGDAAFDTLSQEAVKLDAQLGKANSPFPRVR